MRKRRQITNIIIFLIIIFLAFMIYNTWQSDDLTSIDEEVIDDFYKRIENIEVIDSLNLDIHKNLIEIDMETSNIEEIKVIELGERITSLFGAHVSIYSDLEIDKKGYGKIFDEYNLKINVENPNNTVLTGEKNTDQEIISWNQK